MTTLLERRVGPYGTIEIQERGSDGARIYVQNGQIQSLARPGGESLLAYIQAMHAILVAAGCRRVLVLGGAGGTLATMLAGEAVETRVVDNNPTARELAERWFWLAPSVAWVTADAREHLGRSPETSDAIVLDTFDGGDLPVHLATAAFFDLARARLARDGLLLVNARRDRGRSPVPMLAPEIEAAGFPLTVFDGPPQICRNAVIVGGPVPAVTFPVNEAPPEARRELAALSATRRPAP